MNRNLLLILLLLISNLTFAQLSYDPIPAEVGGYTTQGDIELDIHIKNEGTENLLLLWKLTTDSKPSEWEFQVCDLNLCYDVNVAECPENKPSPMPAGATAPFIFHTLPHEVEGVGNFTLEIFTQADPSTILLTIPITSTVLFTSTKDPFIENLRLFPNPTQDFFQLSSYSKEVTKLSIYNIVGKEMKSFKVQEGASYDVSGLSSGMYLVRLYDDKKRVKKVIRLSKR
jgi:hypothetical protein